MSLARYLSKLGALLNSSGQVLAAGHADASITRAKMADATLGNFSGVNFYNTSTTVAATEVGKMLQYNGGGNATLTLPAATSVPAGSSFLVWNNSGATLTLNATGGGSFYGPSGSGSTAFNLINNTTQQVFSDGYNWLSVLGDGNQSLSGSGYKRLSGGLIIQWGAIYGKTDGSTTTVTFPVAFPTGPASIVGLQRGVNGADQYQNGWRILVGSESASSFQVRQNSNGTNDWYWIAIGY